MKTPFELAAALQQIVAEETGCEVSWHRHAHPIDAREAAKVYGRALVLLLDEYQEAVCREVTADAAELERIHIANVGEDIEG